MNDQDKKIHVMRVDATYVHFVHPQDAKVAAQIEEMAKRGYEQAIRNYSMSASPDAKWGGIEEVAEWSWASQKEAAREDWRRIVRAIIGLPASGPPSATASPAAPDS